MHPASDLDPALARSRTPLESARRPAPKAALARGHVRFLEGLELVEPGLVRVPEWRPDDSEPPPAQLIPFYGVVAKKP
jgi:hypothetical protein